LERKRLREAKISLKVGAAEMSNERKRVTCIFKGSLD
jgi:hypothetical protein